MVRRLTRVTRSFWQAYEELNSAQKKAGASRLCSFSGKSRTQFAASKLLNDSTSLSRRSPAVAGRRRINSSTSSGHRQRLYVLNLSTSCSPAPSFQLPSPIFCFPLSAFQFSVFRRSAFGVGRFLIPFFVSSVFCRFPTSYFPWLAVASAKAAAFYFRNFHQHPTQTL